MVVVCYWSVSCKSSEKRKLLKFLIKNDMNVKMNDVQLCTDKKCITNTAVFHKKIRIIIFDLMVVLKLSFRCAQGP